MPWFKWVPSSEEKLKEAEDAILKDLRCSVERIKVEISDNNYIHTLKVPSKQETKRPPLVLIHGYAAGVGLWTLNLEGLSKNQDVYAIDLLGFGRSSRPKFPSDQVEAENVFVSSIEEWRSKLNLEMFVLLGHSFGGYLSVLYAINFPHTVARLILADSWGFPDKSKLENYMSKWKLCVVSAIASTFNPLSFLRVSGPYGPSLIDRIRPDIRERYELHYGEGDTRVTDYIYHCNVQQPSGELAFLTLSSVGFANRPLKERIHTLDTNIPVTILYGSDSWIVRFYDFHEVKELLPKHHVDLQEICDAGHHLYSDQPHMFNYYVEAACAYQGESL